MEILQQILIMLLTLAILIAFHEWGHFWVARRCGVKVLRYSIGFGPKLFSWTDKLGTEFALSILPLGGYVKMLDEREGEVDPSEVHLAFNNKSVARRIAIVSAGPIANFILAVAVYWFVFLQGVTGLAPVVFSVEKGSEAEVSGLQVGQEIVAVDHKETPTAQAVALALLNRLGETGQIHLTAVYPGSDSQSQYNLDISQWLSDEGDQVRPLTDLGVGFYRPSIKAVIAEVMADSAAERAGLLSGDLLFAVDGKPIDDWVRWVEYVRDHGGEALKLSYRRDGLVFQTEITPDLVDSNGTKIGVVGIRVELPEIPESLLRKQEYNVLTAWVPAVERTYATALFSLMSLKKMLTGDISYKQLSGPISIAKVATQSAESGIYSYLSLLALLSVSLGVLNLLPIPVLDGGHIFFYLIEWIKGGPVPEKIQIFAYQIGLAVVMAVMVLAVVNDVGRL